MAGFSNIYPNLPGMMVEFKDGGMSLRQDVTVNSSDSLLILGTAVDGPILDPVAVDDESVEAVFGKATSSNGVSNGSTLVKAYKQARKRGCNDIRLMRVTGKNAKATLEGPETVLQESKRVEEEFAVITGNDVTVITLSNKPVTKDSVKLFIKGSQLLTGYTVEYSKGEVSIQAGVCDAGAPITVQYSYCKPVTVTNEEVQVGPSEGNFKATIAHPSTKEGMTINFNSSPISPDNFSVSGNIITLTSGSGVADTDTISVSYTHYEGDKVDVTESGKGPTPFVTQTSVVTKTLAHTPSKDSVKVYVGGSLHTDQSVVQVADKVVTIDKKHFPRGAKVTVEYLYELKETIKTELKFESFFGGSAYNKGSIEVVDLKNASSVVIGKRVIITKPDSKKVSSYEQPLVYDSTDYLTFGLLADAITADAANGMYKVTTDNSEVLTSDLKVTKTFFTGGEDGVNLSKQEMFEALSGKRDSNGYLTTIGAYQLLEDYSVDWIVPVGVYADEDLNDRNQNFAYELALLCAVLSYRNKTTLGAISMKPNRDTSLAGVQEYAKHVASFKNLFYMKDQDGNPILDSEGKPMDLGMYLSVVAGPEIEERDNSVGVYYTNAAVDYVAMNTVLFPQSAPTNKVIAGANKLRFSFSNAQLDGITGNRIVTFKNKIDRNGKSSIVVVDGVTAAHPYSDYTRITTPKSLRTIVDHVREVCEPFIGEPNTIEQRNAMSSAISKRLSILKEKGVLLDSAFQILVTPQDQVLGSARLELTIVPPQELRKITTVVGLKANL